MMKLKLLKIKQQVESWKPFKLCSLDFNNQIFYILKMSNHIIKNDYIFFV
jgi:hypothetical protein